MHDYIVKLIIIHNYVMIRVDNNKIDREYRSGRRPPHRLRHPGRRRQAGRDRTMTVAASMAPPVLRATTPGVAASPALRGPATIAAMGGNGPVFRLTATQPPKY